MPASRREFIQQIAAGVSLAWGGLRIFAGPAHAISATQLGQAAPPAKPFLYGTQFFRPPNPPRYIAS